MRKVNDVVSSTSTSNQIIKKSALKCLFKSKNTFKALVKMNLSPLIGMKN